MRDRKNQMSPKWFTEVIKCFWISTSTPVSGKASSVVAVSHPLLGTDWRRAVQTFFPSVLEINTLYFWRCTACSAQRNGPEPNKGTLSYAFCTWFPWKKQSSGIQLDRWLECMCSSHFSKGQDNYSYNRYYCAGSSCKSRNNGWSGSRSFCVWKLPHRSSICSTCNR